MGKMVFALLATIAEFERERIRKRVVTGMKEARRRGKHCGRRAEECDIEKAAALRQSGLSWRKLASATGVPLHLLRTRLASVQNSGGEWGAGAVP
jgi:Enterobacteriaceae phage serine recombinase